MKYFRATLPWLWLVVLLGLSWGARTWNRDQIFVGGKTAFVDADCYSRMTRVQQVVREPWKSIRFHDFENAPFGITPHTTAPMDLSISMLACILRPFSPDNINLAGAYISPLLGLVLVAFLWCWSRRLKLPFGNGMLLLVAVSPILAHGFLLGRPDHQSLILLLVGAALAAEIAIWMKGDSAWRMVSAICWGLALWTSLFEPLVLLLATMACRILVLGRDTFRIRHRPALGVFLAILVLGFLFDGWRSPPSAPEIAQFFPRWSQTIGELNHLSFGQLYIWTGWLLPVVPILLFQRFLKEKNRICLALAILVLLTIGLCLWYARWGYFLSLIFALSLPFAFAAIPWRPVVWTIFLISLWPIAGDWDSRLYPDDKQKAALDENREDAFLLRDAAGKLVSPEREIILAPWWLSPAFAYWSGQPNVAGSSHQSLPGIVDSARFYLSSDLQAAREILRKRKTTYVVAYEPSRVIQNSAQILGVSPPREPLAKILYDTPYVAPDFLRLVYENKYFKIYEFNDQ